MKPYVARAVGATLCVTLGAVIGGASPIFGLNRQTTPVTLVPTWDQAALVAIPQPTATDLTTTTIASERFLDTRPEGAALGGNDIPLGANETRTVQIGGLGSVPSDAVSVIVNITAVNASAPSFITAFPAGTSRPPTSLLNPAPNTVAFNSTTVELAGGALSLYNLAGTVDVIVDVMGFMTQDLKVQTDALDVGLAQVNLGDVIAPPQFAGGFWDTTFAPDWRATAETAELAGLLNGVETTPGRYSTVELELIVQSAGNADVPQLNGSACFRIASVLSGPVIGSDVCVDMNDATLYERTFDSCLVPFGCITTVERYWKYTGPRVAVPAGTLYLEGKALEGGIDLARYYFRYFG